MSLKDQITEDMKNAMRAKEVARLGAIRLLLAAIKQRHLRTQIWMLCQKVYHLILLHKIS